MAYKTTLAEVAKAPGTCRQIHARLNSLAGIEAVSVELLTLFNQGKVTRVKTPQPTGRPVFVYSVADEAASQA